MRDGYQTTPLNCGYLPGNSTCVPYGCGSTRCGKRRNPTTSSCTNRHCKYQYGALHLGALESAQSVAERFGISVAELRKLNQFRTFARGFDNVRQGDELDVPAQVSEKN